MVCGLATGPVDPVPEETGIFRPYGAFRFVGRIDYKYCAPLRLSRVVRDEGPYKVRGLQAASTLERARACGSIRTHG
jgi:hypothetical protein